MLKALNPFFNKIGLEQGKLISYIPVGLILAIFPTFFVLDKSDNRNLFYAAVLICLLSYWNTKALKEFFKINKKIFYALGAYTAYFLLSLLWSDHNSEMVFKAIKMPALILIFIVSFFMCARKYKFFLLAFEWTFIIGASFAALYLLIDFILKDINISELRSSYRMKGPGRLENSNLLAQAFSIAILMTLFGAGRYIFNNYKYILVLKTIIVLLLSAIVILTGSRGAAIALIMSIASIALLAKKRSYYYGLFIGIIGLSMFLIVNQEMLSNYLDNIDSYRFTLWQEAFGVIQNNIILGIGLGTEYIFGKDVDFVFEWSSAHNILIGHLFVGGLIGLIFFLAMFAIVFYSALKLENKDRDLPLALFVFAAIITLSSSHTLFFNLSSEWLFLWVPLSYVLIYRYKYHHGK